MSIYLDHAATTQMKEPVIAAMEPYFIDRFENAMAGYEKGRDSRKAVEQARNTIAHCIGARPEEIFFTSGGSESDNWVVKSVAKKMKKFKNHILTSAIEHHAILNSCRFLEPLGYKVTYLPVDSFGRVSPETLERNLSEDAALVTIMYGNNEIGTVEPIMELARIARKHEVLFHTDAVQAIGHVPLDVRSMPVDALSASAHKFCGPKGVGFLYLRQGTNIPGFIDGGSQERGKRAGTENVAGIVGMAKALEMSMESLRETRVRVTKLRNYFIGRVLNEIEDVRLNGHPNQRLPGNVNFSFKGIEATTLLVILEDYGIMASAGSACTTGTTRISHVIEALHLEEEYAAGTMRFSLGEENTKEEMDYVLEVLKKAVSLLRK